MRYWIIGLALAWILPILGRAGVQYRAREPRRKVQRREDERLADILRRQYPDQRGPNERRNSHGGRRLGKAERRAP